MQSPKLNILEIAKTKIIELLLATLGVLGAIFLPHFDPTFLERIFPGMSELDYKKVCLIILLYLILLSAYICLLLFKKDKINFNDYKFDPFDGCWQHKKKGWWICASCKADNILSPLALTDDWNMVCPRCGKPAKNTKLNTLKKLAELQPVSVNLDDYAKK